VDKSSSRIHQGLVNAAVLQKELLEAIDANTLIDKGVYLDLSKEITFLWLMCQPTAYSYYTQALTSQSSRTWYNYGILRKFRNCKIEDFSAGVQNGQCRKVSR